MLCAFVGHQIASPELTSEITTDWWGRHISHHQLGVDNGSNPREAIRNCYISAGRSSCRNDILPGDRTMQKCNKEVTAYFKACRKGE